MKPAEGFCRFNAFLNHTYHERYLKGLGLALTRQQRVAAIAALVQVQHLSWPQSWDDVDRAVALIEEDLKFESPSECTPSRTALAA